MDITQMYGGTVNGSPINDQRPFGIDAIAIIDFNSTVVEQSAGREYGISSYLVCNFGDLIGIYLLRFDSRGDKPFICLGR